MKARLFVVNEKTLEYTVENKEVSVIVPEPDGKKMWKKTLIDIVSDLFQIEIGDYIFLWESGKGRIYGVYRAISKPFFRNDGGNDIFKIKIDVAYEFDKPIKEYDVINNPYMKNKLWNIIGKKVAGKSRGSSPITPEEMEFLIQSLIDANNRKYTFHKKYSSVCVDNEIMIDFENDSNTECIKCLSEYDNQPIRFKIKKEVQYEKALEGLLNLFFREKNKKKLVQLNIDCDNVIWFANYLPYGLEKSEIDYMVMESIDGSIVNRIDVIELMSSVIDEDHINRCLQYAKWVATSIVNDKNIVRPIIICGDKSKTSKNGFKNEKIQKAIAELPREYGFDQLEIFTYSTENGVTFCEYDKEENV